MLLDRRFGLFSPHFIQIAISLTARKPPLPGRYFFKNQWQSGAGQRQRRLLDDLEVGGELAGFVGGYSRRDVFALRVIQLWQDPQRRALLR